MKIMLKTLESGILSECIVNRLRPFLVDFAVSDTALIDEMSKAKSKQRQQINSLLAEEDEKYVKILALEAF